MVSSPSALSASAMNRVNTDFILQSYVTELNDISALLEGVIRIKVLATLIWDYSGLDEGRERVHYFLDRMLSPSPSFILSYEPTIWEIVTLFDLAVDNAKSITGGDSLLLDTLTARIMLHDREILKIDRETEESTWTRAREKALHILRKDEVGFKYVCLSINDLNRLRGSSSLDNLIFRTKNLIDDDNLDSNVIDDIDWIDYIRDDLLDNIKATQITGIVGDDSQRHAKEALIFRYDVVLPFKLLSCQKKPFDLQLDVQMRVEKVICHLRLNGLLLHGTSAPGYGKTVVEAIDSVLDQSSLYLQEMISALTYHEFRIIETELFRRSTLAVLQNPMNANILQQNCSVDLM